LLSDDDIKKLRYILTPPQGIQFLRMTRPIEKAHRTAGCQQISLLVNLFTVAVFILAVVVDYVQYRGETEALPMLLVACAFFGLTCVFYVLTTGLNPGYVEK